MSRTALKRSVKIKSADRSPPAVTFEQDATPQRLAMVASRAEEALRSRGERMAKVRRLIPPIDTLRDAGKLTDDQHRALTYYRDQADMANRSPIKDSLNKTVGGGSEFGLSAAVVSALLTVARIEKDMGSVRDIARAIAVDDMSLTAWCVKRHGGRERYDGKGRFVAVVPIREEACMKQALLELRYAAGTIVR